MKILFITQKVDKNDDLLGVYCEWARRIAEKFESVIAICLYKGEYDLPFNVKVFSLGKEAGASKIKYVINFYKYIWHLRKEYDAVFVHMNQEYVILGGLLWILLRKRIFFWRNHMQGNLFTKIAVKLSEKVFCTSPYSFIANFKNCILMPAGIDTERFIAASEKSTIRKNKILSMGRISPIKNLEPLIVACQFLEKEQIVYSLDIFGVVNPGNENYLEKLKKTTEELRLKNKIFFKGSVPFVKTPEVYSNYDVFVNLTDSGSLDKTIFEAMAAGCIPVVSNKSFEKIFPNDLANILIFKENDSKDLEEKIVNIFNMPENKKTKISKILKKLVVEKHSLNKLIKELTDVIKETN